MPEDRCEIIRSNDDEGERDVSLHVVSQRQRMQQKTVAVIRIGK